MLDFMVEFYGNMITLCIYLKHEVYTLLLLDIPIGMQEPCIGQLAMYISKQYLY